MHPMEGLMYTPKVLIGIESKYDVHEEVLCPSCRVELMESARHNGTSDAIIYQKAADFDILCHYCGGK